MKKIIAILAFGVLVTGTSFAQNTLPKEKNNRSENRVSNRAQRLTPEERAAKRTEMLAQKLDLSAKQKKQLQALNLKQAQEQEAFRSKYSASNDRALNDRNANERNQNEFNQNQRQERKKMNDRWEAGLKEILNKKQYAKYETERNQAQGRWNGEGKENGKSRLKRPVQQNS